MIPPSLQTPERRHIRTLSTILLAAFLIVGAALFFWGVVRAAAILARDDNPRLVESALSIQRGTIFDRDGRVLARNQGAPGNQQRVYPQSAGGPAVGYYSFTYGTAGAEDAFDDVLSGAILGDTDRYWQETLHLPQKGFDLRLALDLELQKATQTLMSDGSGAVLLLEVPYSEPPTAWVRVMQSFPGYDPNRIDEEFQALGTTSRTSLLNRVTQGQYQPGLLLQPFILASALEQGLVQFGVRSVQDPAQPVNINHTTIHCIDEPLGPVTWEVVLQQQCPAPMVNLADRLGTGGVDAAVASFGLDRDPLLKIDTTTSPNAPTEDPLLAGIGQENLSVTPLQIGLAMAALAGDGRLPQGQLAEAVMDENGVWHEVAANDEAARSVSQQTAETIWEALPTSDGIHELSTLVVSGPGDGTNAWYIGSTAGETANRIVVVVLESSDDLNAAARVGRRIITADE